MSSRVTGIIIPHRARARELKVRVRGLSFHHHDLDQVARETNLAHRQQPSCSSVMWIGQFNDKMGSLLLVTAQSQYSVHIIFTMSCELAPGNYNVLSYIDGNVVNACPSLAPADVVILNNVTPITLTGFKGPPVCTYLIQVHGGYVKSKGIPNTLQSIDDGNAVTWVFKYHPDKQAYRRVIRIQHSTELQAGLRLTFTKAFNYMTTLQPDGLTQEVNPVAIVNSRSLIFKVPFPTRSCSGLCVLKIRANRAQIQFGFEM